MATTNPPNPAGTARAAPAAATYQLVLVDQPPPQPPPRPRVGGPRRPQRQLPPRTVAPDSHRPHGTHAKYVIERCGCPSCRDANRDYERRRQRAMARPDEVWAPYVDAGPARQHLARLAAAGVGLKQVAAVSGLGHGVLSKIVYGDAARHQGPSKRIRPVTARRILAVTVNDLADGAKVDGAATWARIDELVAAGYTKTWIADQLGRTLGNLRRRPQVRESTAAAVTDLHRRHVAEPPPPRNTRWGPR